MWSFILSFPSCNKIALAMYCSTRQFVVSEDCCLASHPCFFLAGPDLGVASGLVRDPCAAAMPGTCGCTRAAFGVDITERRLGRDDARGRREARSKSRNSLQAGKEERTRRLNVSNVSSRRYIDSFRPHRDFPFRFTPSRYSRARAARPRRLLAAASHAKLQAGGLPCRPSFLLSGGKSCAPGRASARDCILFAR